MNISDHGNFYGAQKNNEIKEKFIQSDNAILEAAFFLWA